MGLPSRQATVIMRQCRYGVAMVFALPQWRRGLVSLCRDTVAMVSLMQVLALGLPQPLVGGVVTVSGWCRYSFVSDATTAFCEGWRDGFKRGWHAIRGLAAPPAPPYCPAPVFPALSTSYADGYDAGFRAGMEAAT